MKKLFVVLAIVLSGKMVSAQTDDQILAYIEKFKDVAVAEMKRTGVPAAITLAQGIHETTAGTSVLVLKSNNHFGIKCKTEWKGESVNHDDDAPQECFRKYTDPIDSYKDHSDFLKNRPYYASLFKLDPMDYKSWAYGLKKAGYATNPRYPQILIKLIEEWDLQEFSYIAMGREQEYYKDHPYLVEQNARKNEVLKKDEVIATASFVDQPKVETAVVKSEVKPELKPVVKQEIKKEEPSVVELPKTVTVVVKNEPQKEVLKPVEVPKPVYPEGEFQVNKTRVIFAKKGTSLLSIADQYKIPLAWIVEFNDLDDENVLEQGQLIFLQRKRKISDNLFHTVAEGESLYSIAQSEGIRLESLLDLNLLNDERMMPATGEKLSLNTKLAKRPLLASEVKKPEPLQEPALNTSLVKHIVQPKEGLYSISKKYGVTVDQIKKWNNLQDLNLKTGQELIINK